MLNQNYLQPVHTVYMIIMCYCSYIATIFHAFYANSDFFFFFLVLYGFYSFILAIRWLIIVICKYSYDSILIQIEGNAKENSPEKSPYKVKGKVPTPKKNFSKSPEKSRVKSSKSPLKSSPAKFSKSTRKNCVKSSKSPLKSSPAKSSKSPRKSCVKSSKSPLKSSPAKFSKSPRKSCVKSSKSPLKSSPTKFSPVRKNKTSEKKENTDIQERSQDIIELDKIMEQVNDSPLQETSNICKGNASKPSTSSKMKRIHSEVSNSPQKKEKRKRTLSFHDDR